MAATPCLFCSTTQVNQPKLPLRTLDPRILPRGPDFTPAFADFGRQTSGGRNVSGSVSFPQLANLRTGLTVEALMKSILTFLGVFQCSTGSGFVGLNAKGIFLGCQNVGKLEKHCRRFSLVCIGLKCVWSPPSPFPAWEVWKRFHTVDLAMARVRTHVIHTMTWALCQHVSSH